MDSYLNRARAARQQKRRDKLGLNQPQEEEFDMESAMSQVAMAAVPIDNPNAPANAPGGQNNDLIAAITTLMKSQTQEIIQSLERVIKESGGLAE